MNRYATQLKQIIANAKLKLHNLDDKLMSEKPNPSKWSPKEILGHLIDSAYNNHQRFVRSVKQTNLIFHGYDQVAWVKHNNYQNRDTNEIINTWSVVINHLAELIGQIDEATLSKETIDHNFDQICMNTLTKGVPTSLSYLVWDYIFHVEHHMAQIIDDYQRILPPFNH